MAVVLGIFDPLIEAVGGFYKDFRRHAAFLIPVVLGAGSGIIAFSAVAEYALVNHSFPTCMFFAGLVAGSIPLIHRKATERAHKKIYLLATLAAALAVVVFSLMRSPDDLDARFVVDTALMLRMFAGGTLAGMIFLIPGISGAFVLILLGIYPVAIRYVASVKDYLLEPTNFALFMDILLSSGLCSGRFSGYLTTRSHTRAALRALISPSAREHWRRGH
jgi:putative membrane protein